MHQGAAAAVFLLAASPALASFVNWESPHVHPVDTTPDGSRLVAVNTADNRLEVFDVTGDAPTHLGSVPVGLDPVTVRALDDREVWVVNHVSDSISRVDLDAMHVIATLTTGDEPTDVVFAGEPRRAFVSMSQLDQIWVFPLDSEVPAARLDVVGSDPRALATDGSHVYAALFESGNATTIVGFPQVSAGGPYGGVNPPPNAGEAFDPPISPELGAPPAVSQIVRKQADGRWLDDNDRDWSPEITWDLVDHDLVRIDAHSLALDYASGLMSTPMAIALRPDGDVTTVGLSARNEVRFEPNLRGTFVTVDLAAWDVDSGATDVADLNPHLDYTVSNLPQSERDRSIGDPRAIVWSDADLGYVAGMGSNNVVAIGADGRRLGRVEVGAGPTGLALDVARGRLYVLSKFDASLSTVDTVELAEIDRVALYDPTPAAIREGRPHLYDTHATSGLGQASCASCHIDARLDQLAWDLGDPTGEIQPFDQNCNGPFGLPFCEDWHPMKGPMLTQTLQGIDVNGALHWRADREELGAFNPAFESLLGDDEQLDATELRQFLDFVATVDHPPNPFRRLDGTFAELDNGGDAARGFEIFTESPLDGGLPCASCHTLPTGGSDIVIWSVLLGEPQSFKVPQLRNVYDRVGFEYTSTDNTLGFGLIHDGSIDTLFNFIARDTFAFPPGEEGTQQQLDVEAYVLSLSADTHAGVGQQTTLGELAEVTAAQRTFVRTALELAEGGQVAVVARNRGGGFAYAGDGRFQSDRAAVRVSTAELLASARTGNELTVTIVPVGSEGRIGIDRDEDGFLDGDERAAGSDPADPTSTP